MESFGVRFGDLIRRKRAERGMTQEELSVRIYGDGSGKSSISRLERGQVERPTARTLRHFSEALEISDTELDRAVVGERNHEYENQNKPKVFISYCREDVDSARALFAELGRAGFDVWADFANLDGGQRWKAQISQAIKDSDFFVALLSNRAINKRGHVQKEIREALEILDTIPEDEAYLLPCRLEECQPMHGALHELHWIDLFPCFDDGIRTIIRGIQRQYLTAFSRASIKREKEKSRNEQSRTVSVPVKLNINISDKQNRALEKLKDEIGAESNAEVLRRALALMEIYEKENIGGSEVIVQRMGRHTKFILPS